MSDPEIKIAEKLGDICGSCLRIVFTVIIVFFILAILFFIFSIFALSHGLRNASLNVDGYRLEYFNENNTQLIEKMDGLDESFDEIQSRLDTLKQIRQAEPPPE